MIELLLFFPFLLLLFTFTFPRELQELQPWQMISVVNPFEEFEIWIIGRLKTFTALALSPRHLASDFEEVYVIVHPKSKETCSLFSSPTTFDKSCADLNLGKAEDDGWRH